METGNAFVGRSDLYYDVCKLTPTAGLFLEDFAELCRTRNGLLVVDLRGSLVDIDAELPAETVDDDVQMELAHTADDGLSCLVVGLDRKGRVLFGEFAEGDAEFVKILLGLWLDGDTDDGIREIHRLEGDRVLLNTDGVACAEVLEADCCADVSGLHKLDRILVVGMHLVQSGDPFLLAGTGIIDIGTGVKMA